MKNKERHREVDHESSNIDERRDERGRRAGGIESDSLQQERKHRSGERSERDDSDERESDGNCEQKVVWSIAEDVQVLPEHNSGEADYAKDGAQHQTRREL